MYRLGGWREFGVLNLLGFSKKEGLISKFLKVLSWDVWVLREVGEFLDLLVLVLFIDGVRGGVRGGGNCFCRGRSKKE